MYLPSWLAHCLGTQPQRACRNHRRSRMDRRRLFLEGLEERRVFALAAPVNYDAGNSPEAIVAADFNNDGVLDLATANRTDSTVSILLGNADGTFQPALTAPTGAGPLSLAVGDLNDDGSLDLATANAYDISVLQGNGDGTFDPPGSHSVPYSPSSVAVGDFNGDGKLDLGVTSNYYSWYYGYYYGYQGLASVLLGDGRGNLLDANFTWLGSGYVGSATAANLDGVGPDEFLVADSDYGSVMILEADVSGAPYVADVLYTGTSATDVAVADVNSDGVADIVTADGYYGSVSVLLGDGQGGYRGPQTFTASSNPSSYSSSVALEDFTGDGNVDIAVADYYSGVNVLYGTGNGAFSVPVQVAAVPSLWALASGDIGGNGGFDIAATNLDAGAVSVLLNDQNWSAPPPGLSINNVEVVEGDTGTVAAVFTVTRSGNLDGSTTVYYSTTNDGALAGSDYVAVPLTSLTFNPGEATKTITVLVNGDLTDEYDQGFYVYLSAPAGAVITDGSGFALILDNDDAPTINITPIVSQKEGNKNFSTFTFIVTLSAASEKGVWVNFSTADGTATASTATSTGDYTRRSGSLYFAPGDTSETISVQVRGDRDRESNERFFVILSGASNATLGTAQGIGEILDDDAPRGKSKPGGG